MPTPENFPTAAFDPDSPTGRRTQASPESDVLWGRRIFKAPPLDLPSRPVDLAATVDEPPARRSATAGTAG